ncbi:MAG: hypothetical protein GY779_04405 [Gammaproteobacteria bacterium]|nr:hypothetical protein [Gammaproteobacteria bacterium]
MKKWQIDYSAMRDELHKPDVILIAGGIAGRAFDGKIDTSTMIFATLGGIASIVFSFFAVWGPIRRLATMNDVSIAILFLVAVAAVATYFAFKNEGHHKK